LCDNSLGRLKYEGEESITRISTPRTMSEHRVLDPSPGRVVPENEVLVWEYGFVLENHDRTVSRRAFDFDVVQRRFQPVDWHARIERDFD
jgi:hypothetical protein